VSGPIGALRLPRDVRFGFDARAALPGVISRLGRRVFVVVDPFLATTTGFADVITALGKAGATVEVHTGVPAELPIDAVRESALIARKFGPDVILGYGGGSALDAAKSSPTPTGISKSGFRVRSSCRPSRSSIPSSRSGRRGL
jgi:alcohol dehydrogenase